MYPMNLQLASLAVGFACANDEAEHAALTASGYLPALVQKAVQSVEPIIDPPLPENAQSVESVRAQLDAAGIAYDKRIGIDKLTALLPV